MSEQSFNQPLDDEITLKDILDFLMDSWKTITAVGILGALLAAGYAFIMHPKYQASASIQVASVVGFEIETPSILLEKMKMPTYFSTTTHSACNVADSIEPGVLIVRSIKPSLSRTAPIISFSYRSSSPTNAKKCLESVFDDVRNSQNLLAKPLLQNKNKELLNLRQKLSAAQRALNNLRDKNSNFNFPDSRFSAEALLFATNISKENEIKDLQVKIFDLENLLLEPHTKETTLIAPVYASSQKVSPKNTVILISGLMAGLSLGLLFMIGRRAWYIYKGSNK